MNPEDLLYSSSHEWIRKGNPLTIGITQFAQDQLGDVVFVELPEAGATITRGETFGSVESVKTVSDIYAPVTGVISEVNAALVNTPELVNSDPYGEGWLIRVTTESESDLDELMDSASYEATVAH